MIEQSQDQQKYMFLSTVKEIIFIKPECLNQYLNVLMPLYLAQSNSKDEPIRNIVAESIGKLFITHPDALTPYIEQSLGSKDAMTVGTYARSFKYSAHNNNQPEKFRKFVGILVELIKHSDLAIKKNSLESLSQIVFNKYLKGLLSDNVEGLIAITLQETPIKPELIVQVDLGPFKYNQDHGAPIRKAAFVLLENMTEKFTFNQSDVVDAVINGFQDSNEDVQQQCLRFMNRLLVICQNIVMSKLDRLVEKMQYIYTKNSNNLKAKNDGQTERSLNLIRGILRITELLQRSSEATSNVNFQNWFSTNVQDN